ncbi:MAG: signal peptidase II [Gemmatimonadales bacterium]
MSWKARAFWPILAVLVLTDCSTKRIVEEQLTGNPGPHPVLGEWLRLTLAYNPDAAMSLSFGPASRLVFSLAAVLALVLLLKLYRQTAPHGRLRAASIALVAGGALGNLLDRLRSSRGVVDFIDVGIGDTRFWTFNVADVGVTVGAILLAVVLWREDSAEAAEAA